MGSPRPIRRAGNETYLRPCLNSCWPLGRPAVSHPGRPDGPGTDGTAHGLGRRVATQEGQRAADLYTPEARLWGSVSREQTVGQTAIVEYFGRTRPGSVAIGVRFGAHALREVGPSVAVASGHYTFLRQRQDGSVDQEPSRFSMTLVQSENGAWRIADHHSSRLPPAQR